MINASISALPFSSFKVLRLTVILCGVWAQILGGCGYYSTSSSLPSHIKTVAIPLFENETHEVGLVEKFTDTVVDGIISNGHLKVVGELAADSVLRGTISNILDEPDTYSRDEGAQKFRIRIFINIEFFDRKKNNVIWEADSMEGFAVYDASIEGEEERDRGIDESLEMISKLIVDRLVTDW